MVTKLQLLQNNNIENSFGRTSEKVYIHCALYGEIRRKITSAPQNKIIPEVTTKPICNIKTRFICLFKHSSKNYPLLPNFWIMVFLLPGQNQSIFEYYEVWISMWTEGQVMLTKYSHMLITICYLSLIGYMSISYVISLQDFCLFSYINV